MDDPKDVGDILKALIQNAGEVTSDAKEATNELKEVAASLSSAQQSAAAYTGPPRGSSGYVPPSRRGLPDEGVMPSGSPLPSIESSGWTAFGEPSEPEDSDSPTSNRLWELIRTRGMSYARQFLFGNRGQAIARVGTDVYQTVMQRSAAGAARVAAPPIEMSELAAGSEAGTTAAGLRAAASMEAAAPAAATTAATSMVPIVGQAIAIASVLKPMVNYAYESTARGFQQGVIGTAAGSGLRAVGGQTEQGIIGGMSDTAVQVGKAGLGLAFWPDVLREIATMPEKIRSWAESLVESKRAIAQWNGELIRYFGESERRGILRDIESGRATGGAVAMLGESYQELLDAVQPIKDAVTNTLAVSLVGLVEGVTFLVEAFKVSPLGLGLNLLGQIAANTAKQNDARTTVFDTLMGEMRKPIPPNRVPMRP